MRPSAAPCTAHRTRKANETWPRVSPTRRGLPACKSKSLRALLYSTLVATVPPFPQPLDSPLPGLGLGGCHNPSARLRRSRRISSSWVWQREEEDYEENFGTTGSFFRFGFGFFFAGGPMIARAGKLRPIPPGLVPSLLVLYPYPPPLCYSTVRYCAARYGAAQYGTARYGTVQVITGHDIS